MPDPPQLAAELEAAPPLKQQMDELRELGAEVVRRVADTLRHAVGALGVEAATVAAAFGVGGDDVAAELAEAFPDARPDEAEAARWAAEWSRGWDRRFERKLG